MVAFEAHGGEEPGCLGLAALAALFGCEDDASDRVQGAEREALVQLLGEDGLAEVVAFDEGEGDRLEHLQYVELRDGHVVRLGLTRAGLTTTAPLAALSRLEHLVVEHNALTALEGLAALPRLKSVRAGYNAIADARGLGGAPALEELYLPSNELDGAARVPDLPTLKTLGLNGNPLGSLEGLPSLSALERLTVAGTGLRSLAGLGRRPALRRLAVSGNALTSLAGIEGAPGLEELVAARNEIVDAGALASLPALERVHLQHNALQAAPPVPEGARLELEGNPVGDRMAQEAADAERWIVAGIDLGPPSSPWVEALPPPRGRVERSSRSCRRELTDVDCRFTAARLDGHHQIEVGDGWSSAPAGYLTVRVRRGKVRAYIPYPTHDAWTMPEATPEAPLETSGATVPLAFGGARLGAYAVQIESVDGPAEGVEVHFRTGFEP